MTLALARERSERNASIPTIAPSARLRVDGYAHTRARQSNVTESKGVTSLLAASQRSAIHRQAASSWIVRRTGDLKWHFSVAGRFQWHRATCGNQSRGRTGATRSELSCDSKNRRMFVPRVTRQSRLRKASRSKCSIQFRSAFKSPLAHVYAPPGHEHPLIRSCNFRGIRATADVASHELA